jgi:hypothetical protein
MSAPPLPARRRLATISTLICIKAVQTGCLLGSADRVRLLEVKVWF